MRAPMSPTSAVLLLSCPDQRGLVAAVAEWIARHDGNVLHADQHIDHIGDQALFFQRVEFALEGLTLDRAEIEVRTPSKTARPSRVHTHAVARIPNGRRKTGDPGGQPRGNPGH